MGGLVSIVLLFEKNVNQNTRKEKIGEVAYHSVGVNLWIKL